MQGNQDIRPIPDPTVLTTEASKRLEETLRSLMTTGFAHQQELFNEKFQRVETQFHMLEARTAEQKQDTTKALSDALSAQKDQAALQNAASEKSIIKSETATIERIKAVETLLATSTKASDDKIDDLKVRIVAIEATKLGNVEQVTATRASNVEMRGGMAAIISIVTTVIAIASIVITIIVVTTHP